MEEEDDLSSLVAREDKVEPSLPNKPLVGENKIPELPPYITNKILSTKSNTTQNVSLSDINSQHKPNGINLSATTSHCSNQVTFEKLLNLLGKYLQGFRSTNGLNVPELLNL